MDAQPTAPVPPPGCPAHQPGGRVPLYGPEYAADPQAYYAYLRHYGPTAPVEIAPGVDATLVTDYATALQLLQDSGSFRKDARRWRDFNEGRIPADSPVLPVLAYRHNCMCADGAEHLRLRQSITDSMMRIDPMRLSQSVERISDFLISQFGERGSADLIGSYAKQLPLFVFNELFGCTADIGDRVFFGITGMFDGVNAEKASEVLFQAVGELIALKRRKPGEDVTSWLLKHHTGLSDDEMLHQVSLLLGAGAEALVNLIGNTLHRLLTDHRYAHEGGLIDEAMDDTLWENPPMTNFAAHYPVSDMEFAGQKLTAGDLMLVSFAGANTGPALSAARKAGSNRAHLAWSAGPHACPSKEPARQIAVSAIENLLNRLPDVELSVPEKSLAWRPGAFSRGLATLPARFTPIKPVSRPSRRPTTTPAAPAPQSAAAPRSEQGGGWSKFLNWLTK
ncbi:Cytochrome P450 [Streptomyces sp. yr375]|uniref:cytochrome P450 n=1 Tax=Streptomyces sp. yr375 TaxID=1761906 RepID=UPI0008AC41DF|nr:cytochrome P450 [Streptomyces sp. yr375]SEQ14744.1 Cytochrome P450 [Streptomyces sp. yr375]